MKVASVPQGLLRQARLKPKAAEVSGELLQRIHTAEPAVWQTDPLQTKRLGEPIPF